MAVDLKALANAVPGLNQQAQKRAQAAANVQLQQQIGAAPAQVPVRAGGQQLAAAQSTQMNKIAVQTQQRQQQQLAQIGQAGIQQQQQQAQQNLATQQRQQQEQLTGEKLKAQEALSDAEIGSRKRMTDDSLKSAERMQKIGLDYDERLHLLSDTQTRDLNRIGNDIKNKIFDARMAFDRDEMGRKFTNARQLADYTISNAQTESQARERLQLMQQQAHRKIELLKTAHSKIVTEINRKLQRGEAKKDFEHQKKLIEMKNAMESAIARAEADASGKRAILQGATNAALASGDPYAIGGAIAVNAAVSSGVVPL